MEQKQTVRLSTGKSVSELSRRSFLKGAGIGTLTVAGSLAACTATTDDDISDAAVPEIIWNEETDVVVIGSGLGGFSAGIAALDGGASCIIVEVSKTSGGGSSYSGGGIHVRGVTDLATYRQYTEELTDPTLGNTYFENYLGYLPWLESLGARFVMAPSSIPNMGFMGDGPGMSTIGCRLFFDSLEEIFAAKSGTLHFETRAERLLTDADNAIIGVRCTKDGAPYRIKAEAVVLASGGFQGDSELRVRYFGPEADMAAIHCIPYTTGNALKMALEVGASLGGSMSTFSSAWAAAWPAKDWMADAVHYETLDYNRDGKYWLFDTQIDILPSKCILVNLEGKRFVSEDDKAYKPAVAAIKQTRATTIMIVDATGWEEWIDQPGYSVRTHREQLDEVILTPEVGGVLYHADTIEELADSLASSGPHKTHRANLIKTIQEYNQACTDGTTGDLDIPRGGQGDTVSLQMGAAAPIVTSPFYAMPLRPAPYCCYGGIAVNTRSQILDKNLNPIPHLYASTPAAGGIMREIYTGGIGMAGVTGREAGKAAAEDLTA
jgi:tricarballylate dehydrogenase